MSDLTAPVAGTDAVVSVPVSVPAEVDRTPIDTTEAARQLSNWRWKRDNPEEAKEKPEPSAPDKAAAAPELAETPTDDQATDPVEPTAEAEPELPTIEPPRSWTKDEKEEFATYPREAQEKIARREQERETALRRSQNEAADKLKGLTAKEQQAEQIRQDYEAALPRVLSAIKDAQAGQFADIKTPADAMALAQTDPARYVQYRAQQDIIAQVETETRAAQERQTRDFHAKWEAYAVEQDKKLIDALPEFADTAKQKQIADAVVRTLENVGVTKEDLGKAWTGEASFSPRDHRFQQIFIKAALYDQAKANVAKPAAKPVPPVQRPGVSRAPVGAKDADVQAAQKQFDSSPTLKNAAALRLAKQRAA